MGRKNNKAFTLVELIIVVSILAFIAIIAIAYFRGQLFKGNDARKKADINRIQVAVEEYEKDHNCYPLPYVVQCNPGTGLQPYLEEIPCDPTTKGSYAYEYEDSSCPSWYRIYALLDNVNDTQVIEDIGPESAYNYYQASPNAPDIETSGTTGGSGPPEGVTFYGCKVGVCQEISWDYSRPGPECDPNYTNSSCYGQCGPEATECKPWQ